MGGNQPGAQVLRGELEQSPVSHALFRVEGVVRAHERGAADEGTVGEYLHGADPQPVIAETGAHPEVQPEGLTLRRQLLGHGTPGGVHGVERGQVRHHGHSHAQPALLAGELERGEIGDGLADVSGCTDARFGGGGDAVGEQLLAGRGDLIRDLLGGLRRDRVGDEGLGGLLQQALGSALVIERHAASLRDPEPGAFGQTGRCEGRGVRHAHVPGVVPQPHRVVRCDSVELGRRGVRAVVEAVLVVSGADDPLPGGRARRSFTHGVQQTCTSGGDLGAQVHLDQGLSEEAHMAVRVVETREHGRPAEVHDPVERGGR